MTDLILTVLGILAVLVFLVVVVRFIEQRAQREGPMFSGPATGRSRVAAFVLSIVFGGFFIVQIVFSDRFFIIIPLLAVALFLYALGATDFIRSLNEDNGEQGQE